MSKGCIDRVAVEFLENTRDDAADVMLSAVLCI